MAGGRTWQLFTANGTAGCLKAEDKRKKVCRRYPLCSPPIDGHVVPLRGRKFSFSAPLPRLSGKLMIQTDTEIQFDLIPKFRVNVNRSTSFIATNVGSVQSRSGADLSQQIRSVADVYASLVL